MDHVLEKIRSFYEIYLEDFLDEQQNGKYKKLSENPYYEELKALIASMNPLREFLGYEKINVVEELRAAIAHAERSKK